jgi:hypothetical protein
VTPKNLLLFESRSIVYGINLETEEEVVIGHYQDVSDHYLNFRLAIYYAEAIEMYQLWFENMSMGDRFRVLEGKNQVFLNSVAWIPKTNQAAITISIDKHNKQLAALAGIWILDLSQLIP